MKKSIFLLSSSSVHGHGFLEYNKNDIAAFTDGISSPVLFVPYAAGKADWDSYTTIARRFFATLGISVTGAHTVPKEKICTDFELIFIGGGNTFRLLDQLQQQTLIPQIREAVLGSKMAYMGSSAGTNMATKSIRTTNDMPIIYPQQGFEGINLFPYQINPHYLDTDPDTKHKGETRDQRIAEFHQENDTPVVGLREGSYIHIQPDFAQTNEIFIGGAPGAKIFLKGKEPFEAPREKMFLFSDLF
jgi:dipeptidase E